MSKNITAIINAEAEKRVDEFRKKGHSEEESIKLALDKIGYIKSQDPLIVIFWEIQKALISKLEDERSKRR